MLSKKLTNFVTSRLFVSLLIGLFTIQGVIFAIVVTPSFQKTQPDGYVTRDGGVVPDGNRHIGAMYYFAERPLLSGPFITDMSDDDLWLGDLERFPSYLYQYLLSFPVRILLALGASDNTIVLAVRLIGVLFGLVALLVLRKIALELGAGQALANLAMLSLAMTGSFAWLSPAENYDILALLLWFVFVLVGLRLFTRNDTAYLYWIIVVFALLSVTKYTYIPFAGVFGAMSVWQFARKNDKGKIWQSIVNQWTGACAKLRNWQVVGLIILLLTSVGLFAERIGVNLAAYQSFSPACTKIHSHEACMNFGVYERNYNRADRIETNQVEPFVFQPVKYASFWLERYFNSMYAYLGHIWIYDFWRGYPVIVVAAVIVVVLLLANAKIRRIRLLSGDGQWSLLAIAVLMVVAQLAINTKSYIQFAGSAYAHQGRYLMAAAGMLYIILLLVLARSLQAMPKQHQRKIKIGLMVFGFVAIVLMSPIFSYWLHAWSAEWYSGPVRDMLPVWWFQFREYVFYDMLRL